MLRLADQKLVLFHDLRNGNETMTIVDKDQTMG